MHPVRKQRLLLVLFVVLFSSAAVGLVVYALSGNINLFFPPAEVAEGKAPVGQSIRVGGMVVENSPVHSSKSNGYIERSVQGVQGMIRTWRSSLEDKWGGET